MKAGEGIGPGGGPIRRAGGLTEAARARRGAAGFLSSFVALQETVAGACGSEEEWQAKVGAVIAAVLRFCASDPEAALTLTVRARRGEAGLDDREAEVLAYFAQRLEQVAPDERSAVSSDRGVVDAIATIVRGHLRAGSARELPGLAAELTYMALLPYTGLAEARRWAARWEPNGRS